MAVEILDSGEVQLKHGVKTDVAKLILEKGRYSYQLRTITKAIGLTIDECIKKHKDAA